MLFDLIRTFCKEDIDPAARDVYAHEAYINHFAITSGMYLSFTRSRVNAIPQ
jgi:hypothetical protein